MAIQRIHIFGAPGSGVTTLGKALANRLGFPHFDTDDYYWFTEDELPYRRKRNTEHRRTLLQRDIDQTPQWVLSGALCGWGDVFIPSFDAAIYMWLPANLRLARIRERETGRYGVARLEEGGDLHNVFHKFLDWAANYDRNTGNLRSRAAELQWLEQLRCPVYRVEAEMPLESLTDWALEKTAGAISGD